MARGKTKVEIDQKLLQRYFGADADISGGFFGAFHVKLANGASVKISKARGIEDIDGGPEIYRPTMALVRDVFGGAATVTGTAQSSGNGPGSEHQSQQLICRRFPERMDQPASPPRPCLAKLA